MTHTPTPWEAHVIPGFKHSSVTTSNPRDPSIDIKTANHAADAAHIVRCVNAHDALAAALEQIASGSFPGASTLAVNGDWHGFVDALQGIARAALQAAQP